MTDRLDRIEAAIEANATQIQTNSAAIAELRTTVNSLVQIVEIHQRNHEVSQRNFEASQRTFETIMNEIRGLRTESQRILEHLFGKEEN
jgi:archaellum component FlaC